MSEDKTNIVRLVERAGGYSMSGQADLMDWALSWLAQLEADGNVRTLAFVVETKDGDLYRLAQSTEMLDGTRLVGLLTTLIYRINEGAGFHPTLR